MLPPLAYPILAVLFGGALVWSFSRILLAVSKHAAPAIALLAALNILIGATLVAYGARVKRRPASFPLLIGAGLAVIAAGIVAASVGEKPEATAQEKGPAPQAVSLVAQGVKFQETNLSVRSGGSVVIDFTNKDANTPHNVALFAGKDATAPPIRHFPIITGPASTKYTFTAPKPGTYFFHCDVHPIQMTGTLTVTAGPASGGPSGAPPGGAGGGLQLTAKSLKFGASELQAKSGGRITIHFVNQDPQIPHNVVVFNGSGPTSPVLFSGPAVTGPGATDYSFAAPPPGRYFFHCQFHPTTMTGTLVVT
jgi:plastocyanin